MLTLILFQVCAALQDHVPARQLIRWQAVQNVRRETAAAGADFQDVILPKLSCNLFDLPRQASSERRLKQPAEFGGWKCSNASPPDLTAGQGGLQSFDRLVADRRVGDL